MYEVVNLTPEFKVNFVLYQEWVPWVDDIEWIELPVFERDVMCLLFNIF
jgi:hypothetical protein